MGVLPRVFAPERLRPLPPGARLRDLVPAMSWRTEAYLDPETIEMARQGKVFLLD